MLRRLTSDRWLAFGAAVAAIAATAIIAIWQAQPQGGYWQLPGISALAVLGVGVAMMLVGFFKRDSREPSAQQTQRAGAGSVNFQAGRDITMGPGADDDGDS